MRRAVHASARRANAARFASGSTPADGGEQRELLHPAAGERVERQHVAHAAARRSASRQRASSARLLGRGPRRPGLVQQHDHRLADPRQHLELRREVAGVGRRLRRVDEVEHDVGLVAHVAHRLLRQPERAVAKAVPDLRQEPADRIALLRAAASRAARCRRSPACPRGPGVSPSAVSISVIRRRLGGDVRRVAHFADVAAEQRARERRLARVGVRDQRQRDVVRRRRDPTASRARARARRRARASAAARSGAARSTNSGATRPLARAMRVQSRAALARGASLVAAPARAKRRLVDEREQRPRGLASARPAPRRTRRAPRARASPSR